MLHAADMQSAMKLKPAPSYRAVNLTYSGLFAVLSGFITAMGRVACACTGRAHFGRFTDE